MKTLLSLCFLLAVSVTAFTQSATGAYSRDPVVTLGNFPGTRPTATITAILGNPNLIIDHTDFKVLSFTISLLPNKGEFWGPFTVKGSELTEEIKAGLKTYAGGSGKIFIENIKAVGPDRRPRNMNSIIVTYTN